MTESRDVNTQYIATWILGDSDEGQYNKAVRIAEGGDIDKLSEFLIFQLRNASTGTGAYYTSREMSDADLETVDWNEIRESLVN